MPLSPEILAKIKSIELKARHLASAELAGEYTSAFKGRGMQFEEVREYCPGDDVRSIDWNVTARMQSPYVKVFSEEREQTVMLALDLSGSMYFGSQDLTKHELAAQFAAAVAFLALRSRDKVGLLLFSNRVEHYIPPRKGQGHIWNLIRMILEQQPSRAETRYDIAVEHLLKVQKKRSMFFLFSDLTVDSDAMQPLRRLSRRHDVSLIIAEDPLEIDCSGHGLLEFADSESGEEVLVDSDSHLVAESWKKMIATRKLAISGGAKKAKIDLGYISTQKDSDFSQPLIEILRKKEGRRLS